MDESQKQYVNKIKLYKTKGKTIVTENRSVGMKG